MEGKQYKVKTHEKYRAVLKKFYEMIYGNYEVYPDCIYYVFGTVREGYKNQKRNIDINKYLTILS